jgi:hypothetical protein
MIAGYMLTGHDNDSNMLGEETRPAASVSEREFYDWRFTLNGGQHPATCPKCGRKTDPDYVDPEFKLRKKTMDVGSTYDGYTIVSGRFRSFVDSLEIQGVDFISLPKLPTHFWFRSNNILAVDTESSIGLRMMNYCDVCDNYAGIFGPSGLRLRNLQNIAIPSGIHRTDLEFAQAHEQSPVFLIGVDLAKMMRKEKFKGLCLTKLEW